MYNAHLYSLFTDAKPSLQDLQYMSYRLIIMDRIRPQVTGLAIALGFPQHIIANQKTEQDPVVYLLTEWLRGGNQEHDSRPLTWGTLISALTAAAWSTGGGQDIGGTL